MINERIAANANDQEIFNISNFNTQHPKIYRYK